MAHAPAGRFQCLRPAGVSGALSSASAFARGNFSFRGPPSSLIGEVAPPNDATELIVQCCWLAPHENGQFMRVSLEHEIASGQWQRAAETIVGPRAEAPESAVMFHLANR